MRGSLGARLEPASGLSVRVTLLRLLDACDAVSAPYPHEAASQAGFDVLQVADPAGSGGRALVAWDGSGALVVAIRGSGAETRRDVLMNVQDDAFAVPVHPGDALPGLPGGARVHAGFLRHWLSLRDAVLEEVARAPHAALAVTGFSLGGACAVLAAAALRERGPSVVAFGAPRVGNGVFAGWFRQAVPDCRRVVLPGDLVPLVPPHPYIHVPSLLRLPRSGPDLRPEHDRGEYRKALSTIE